MKRVLSIQSSVAYGHAGNSAAVFPLQRMGVDVVAVYTVHFSNHTGYGAWRGPLLSPDDVRDVVTGVDERGGLTNLDAMLTGYLGAEPVGEVVLWALDQVKERSPHAIYCCDPVMGDVGRGFFVREGIPEYFRDHVVPRADVVTPNHFELNYLTGREATTTMPDVLAAADELRQRGPGTVLITSVDVDDAEPDTLTMVAVTGDGAWQVTTPKLGPTFTGSGDLTAATFLTHLLGTGSAEAALEATANIVFGVLKATAQSGRRELQLVAAQEEMVTPTHAFGVERLR